MDSKKVNTAFRIYLLGISLYLSSQLDRSSTLREVVQSWDIDATEITWST
jgi:hypothetical protein